MRKILNSIWDTITYPFVSIAIWVDESRRNNEDGSWDKYWERKNKKLEKSRKGSK